jgi:tetratricopeptide (TPR) repeat protein
MTLSQLEHARRQLDHARAALAAGLADLAATHIQDSLRRCPDLAAARIAQADLFLLRDQPRRALAALDCLDLYDAQQRAAPQAQFLRAQALVRAGYDQQATALLHRLAEQYPDDVRPYRLHAGLALKLGQVETAIVHLRRVLELEPSDGASRRLLTELLAGRDPQGAIDALRAAPADGDDPRATRLTLARLCRQAGRDADAQDLYAELLRDDQTDAALGLEAGILADDHGADRLAVRRLQAAVQASTRRRGPGAPELAALARAHQHAGRAPAAARCWFRAARLGAAAGAAPAAANLEAQAGLLICALEAGRDRLVQRVQKDLTTHSSPQERRHHLARHWCHTALGRVIRLIRNPAQAAPQGSPLARLLQRSIPTLQAHARDFPQRADTHYHLALCLDAAGNPGAARPEAATAVSLNPRYTAAQRLASRIDPAPRLAA